MSKRLFSLGQIVSTPGALELLEKHNLNALHFIQKHVAGSFGDLCDEDREANNEAIWNGERILSSYKVSESDRLWVITEADRSSTCLLLPEEY